MTDAEKICEWMEPKPPRHTAGTSMWWRKWPPDGAEREWLPVLDACPEVEKLGRLHEVEARLTAEQWERYAAVLSDLAPAHTDILQTVKLFVHASAEQKTRALAAVIRECA